MAKFTIECPHCGTLNQASSFIFAKKVIKCGNCQVDIDIKANRLTTRQCPHCDNVFVYDQKKKKTECPACRKPIDPGFGKIASFPCPECNCIIQIDENTKTTTCHVCDHFISDVPKEISKSKLVSDGGISVIKYEGDNDNTLIWKHPIEDFNYGSQLIVHESQEAIFFMNGQALDTFGPGRYSLETENLPLIKRMQTMPTGKQNPFHAEVYFINKAVRMNINWGTSQKVRFFDPTSGLPLEVGAHGSLNLQVADGRKLLVKLVGTTDGMTIFGKNYEDKSRDVAHYYNNNNSVIAAFKPLIQSTIKSNLGAILKNNEIDILEYDEKIEEISAQLREKLIPGFEEYGLTIPQFYISAINYDENDPNIKKLISMRGEAFYKKEIDYAERMRLHALHSQENIKKEEILSEEHIKAQDIESRTRLESSQRQLELEQQETALQAARAEAERKRAEALGDADVMKIKGMAGVELKRESGLADAEIMRAKGYTEKDVIAADVQKAYAQGIGQLGSNAGGGSGGGGSMVSDILGLGVGLAAVGQVGDKVSGIMGDFSKNANEFKENVEDGWTCSACGATANKGKFCSECGKAKPELWDCTACGAKGNKGKFCSECGKAKPEAWDCPECGAKGNKGKFCSECGKPFAVAETWDCSCGNKNITGKFCNECGSKKGEVESDG